MKSFDDNRCDFVCFACSGYFKNLAARKTKGSVWKWLSAFKMPWGYLHDHIGVICSDKSELKYFVC